MHGPQWQQGFGGCARPADLPAYVNSFRSAHGTDRKAAACRWGESKQWTSGPTITEAKLRPSTSCDCLPLAASRCPLRQSPRLQPLAEVQSPTLERSWRLSNFAALRTIVSQKLTRTLLFQSFVAVVAAFCCLFGSPEPAAASIHTGIVRQPSIDAAGDRVAFWSTGNPVGDNPDGNTETFLSGNNTGSPGLPLQLTNSTGSILGGFNLAPSIDYNGNYVAFFSDRNLNSAGVQVEDGVTGGNNPDSDFQIFLANIDATGHFTVTQVTNMTGGASIDPSISGDGSEIALRLGSQPRSSRHKQ